MCNKRFPTIVSDLLASSQCFQRSPASGTGCTRFPASSSRTPASRTAAPRASLRACSVWARTCSCRAKSRPSCSSLSFRLALPHPSRPLQVCWVRGATSSSLRVCTDRLARTLRCRPALLGPCRLLGRRTLDRPTPMVYGRCQNSARSMWHVQP